MVDKFDKQPEQPDRLEEETASDRLRGEALDGNLRPFRVLITEALPVVADSVLRYQLKPAFDKLFSQIESRIAARRASQDVLSRLSREDQAMDDAYAHMV